MKVRADHDVEVKQLLTAEDGGFHRLDVTLSNQGNETLTVESIEIRIPLAGLINNDMG